ncbi:PepSY-associated TM helix domain-containing protein [Alteromonas oceanisediminis]|uniref:PepSY-associated TM helix domain-containing protein n=1 Tax=Alteromonas oceanisediminis TaxID=2836180 RepID=UPI001BDA50E4|nr:PepSY-associated TM helix domain-containing protein [Alteromonas oceanisediminis]MBT0585992.1 PepSY domain-containing protein [Alteromonas oceanisediminis]
MRKTLFKWHSYAALFALLPILIVSLTGAILVFKVEIDSALRPQHMVVTPQPNAQRMSIDQLMQHVTQDNPDYALAGWELFDDRMRSDTAYIIRKGTDEWHKVYIDQYSGAVLSQPQPMTHYLTDWLLELHYAFLLQFSGTVIGVFIGLIMLFLGISGMVLYRHFWRKVFTLRWRAAKRILLSDLHKFVGILASPVFILISLTGVYWNVSILLHEVIEHGFESEHEYISAPYHAPIISFETLRRDAASAIDSFQATYLAIPNEPDMQITFFGDVNTSNPFISQYASMITYDRNTGEQLFLRDIRQASVWAMIDDSTRKLHFGYFGGIVSKVIWCIVGLTPVLLAITGVWMFALRKKPAKRNIQRRRR